VLVIGQEEPDSAEVRNQKSERQALLHSELFGSILASSLPVPLSASNERDSDTRSNYQDIKDTRRTGGNLLCTFIVRLS